MAVSLGSVARRLVPSLLVLASAALPASADRASATAAMPTEPTTPFLRIAGVSEDAPFVGLVSLPDYAVYPDGTFLVQMRDGRLWGGRLPPEQTTDLMDFLLSDVGLGALRLDYTMHSPFASATDYAIQTRTGRNVVRKWSKGIGAGDGERALKRLDERLFTMAPAVATAPYDSGRLFVVSRRVRPDDVLPVWAKNDTIPFAALLAATDADRTRGAVLQEEERRLVGEALAQSGAWRLGAEAAEFRVRPAFPEETALPAWRSPTAPKAPSGVTPAGPTPAGPTPAVGPEAGAPPAAAPTGANPAGPAPVAGAPAGDWRADDLDYAGLVQLLKDLKRPTTGAPHGKFWTKPYAAFVAFEFEAGGGVVKLIVKGDGAKSNLVRALEGKPLTVTMPDGKTKEETFALMPPKGGPVPPGDIERIRRWIDHGAPETKPEGAGGGGAPASEPGATAPSTAPAATTVSTATLSLVGEATLRLGDRASQDDGGAPPTLYVACGQESWLRMFERIRARGANGPTIADQLTNVRDEVKGYDFGGSPLLVLIGPATDNYALEVAPKLEMLSDGSARLSVTHRHEVRNYVKAPEVLVRWAIYRSDAKCSDTVTFRDTATNKVHEASR